MKKAIIAVISVSFGVALLIGACSGDKDTNPTLTQGDDSDPTYQQVQALAIAFADSMSCFAEDGFNYLTFDGTRPLKATSDSASIFFNADSYWWAIYVHSDTANAALTFTDSVRFERGDSFTILPDTLTTTGIEYRASLNFSLTGDSSSLTGDFTRGLHITGIQADQVIFNGYSADIIGLDLGQSSIDQTYTSSISNVVFNHVDLEGNNAHPVAGTIALDLNLQTTSPRGSGSSAWSIDFAFFIDHFSIHFESGNNYWDWDGPYGG